MKKFLIIFLVILIIGFSAFYAFVYFLSFSQGYRAGELVKFSKKGVLFKTWEGEISQGVSEAQVFYFSVQDNEPDVIKKLKNLQGKTVKLTYKERFKTFPWWGDTKYFVTEVVQTNNNQNMAVPETNKSSEAVSSDPETIKALKTENDMLKQRIKDLETTIEILRSSSNN